RRQRYVDPHQFAPVSKRMAGSGEEWDIVWWPDQKLVCGTRVGGMEIRTLGKPWIGGRGWGRSRNSWSPEWAVKADAPEGEVRRHFEACRRALMTLTVYPDIPDILTGVTDWKINAELYRQKQPAWALESDRAPGAKAELETLKR